MRGVVIAGTGSGVGKTSVVTGLLSSLSRRTRVQAFKVGPDFIDPMYHTAATGRQSRNLDTFLMDRDTVRSVAAHACRGADMCIVEGVRGLYEGLSGTTEECSTAEMAKILGLPVVLVVNARSLTRSAAAVINGFKSFDPGVDIRGVILNNVSGAQHERKLREAIDRYTDVEIVGIVRRSGDAVIGQRHLGLKTISTEGKEEISHLESLAEGIDTDRLADICGEADWMEECADPYAEHRCGLKAAVPMDDAYCFYYRENLECMEAAGMDVTYFSPVAGDDLPDADFYYLGGGYPELFASEISENRAFLEGLKTASDDGKAILGECGGLLTMCGSLETSDGARHPMSGIFDAEVRMAGRHGPSYVIADTTPENPLFGHKRLRGHEFHYSETVPSAGCGFGFKMIRGTGIKDGMDGLVMGRSLGTYMHQHAMSTDDWLSGVIESAD